MTPDQIAQHDANLRRSLNEPIPKELRERIADLIEPHTINMSLDHGDVMECIDVSWPVIRDWLNEHAASASG